MTEQEIVEQVYTCASCGYCRFGCAVYNEIGFESLTVRGRMQILKKILEGKMKLNRSFIESIYLCAQCENCTVNCPTNIDFVEISKVLRETFLKNHIAPEIQVVLSENLSRDSNPFREPLEERGAWLHGDYTQDKKSDYLYFVGCTGSYSLNRIPKSIMRILDQINFKYSLLGSEERCCGSPILRTGDRETATKTIERNVEQFHKLDVKTIITSCAGCHTTFKHEYPQEFTYIHFTQLFSKLIRDGILTFKKELNEKVIYFDGCDLGRHSGIYEAPREILKAIPGVDLIEFQYNRDEAECCGGPVLGANADLARKIGASRVSEANDKGATLLITACPTCLLNLKDGARSAGLDIKIQDLTLLLPRYVKPKNKNKEKNSE